VNQAAALPSFSDYAANYGSKVPNTSNLRGKKIMIIRAGRLHRDRTGGRGNRHRAGHEGDDLRQPRLDR
jgi:hypothetical protein